MEGFNYKLWKQAQKSEQMEQILFNIPEKDRLKRDVDLLAELMARPPSHGDSGGLHKAKEVFHRLIQEDGNMRNYWRYISKDHPKYVEQLLNAADKQGEWLKNQWNKNPQKFNLPQPQNQGGGIG